MFIDFHSVKAEWSFSNMKSHFAPSYRKHDDKASISATSEPGLAIVQNLKWGRQISDKQVIFWKSVDSDRLVWHYTLSQLTHLRLFRELFFLTDFEQLLRFESISYFQALRSFYYGLLVLYFYTIPYLPLIWYYHTNQNQTLPPWIAGFLKSW